LKLYEIMKALIPKTRGAIIYAVYNTLKHLHQTGSFTPKKQTGRPPLLNTPFQQELKAFVQENSENRRLCAKKLSTVWTSCLKNPISAFTIR
ncbi:1599_t:CDS:2, partial [Funneliformis geosporum]